MKKNKTISIESSIEEKGLNLVKKLECKSFSNLIEKLINDRCKKLEDKK